MKDLILHPQTRQDLARIAEKKPHAIMLIGNEGSGKRQTALCLAETMLEEPIINHPYFIHLEPAAKAFTIDQIRELHKLMKLKTTGKKAIRRVAVLQDVHLMTVEAQNALLKLLEEPPSDTVLILTAQGDASLKPTIYSRVQRVHIKPVSLSEASHQYSKQQDIAKLHSLSGGDMGVLTAMITNQADHPLVKAIEEAKKIITESVFDRLCKVDHYGKQKEDFATLIVALKRISSTALKAAALKNDMKSQNRWEKILSSCYDCEKYLHTNTNSKLLITELFLDI